MSTELESKSGREDFSKRGYLEVIGRAAPGIALLAGLLYVLGLYTAYRLDSSLGVGTIEVSRERAVSLGIVNLVLLLPSIAFWFNVRENRAALSAEKLLERAKTALMLAVVPAIVAFMIIFLSIVMLGVKETTALSLVVLFPITTIVMFSISSDDFARHLVNGWPLFLAIILPLLASIAGAWLPSEFGGHAGKGISIILKDGTLYQGTHRVSDSQIIVISSSGTNTAISRDEISTVHSKED